MEEKEREDCGKIIWYGDAGKWIVDREWNKRRKKNRKNWRWTRTMEEEKGGHGRKEVDRE